MEPNEEKFISVPEQGGGSLISDGPMNPGVLHIVGTGNRSQKTENRSQKTEVTATLFDVQSS